MLSKFFRVTFLFLVCLTNYACFEYEETIHFKKGFAGFVEISYTVPMKQKSESSLIKFLPLSETEINSRINKGIFSKNIQIKDYSLRILERDDREEAIFKQKAKVSYKIEFTEINQLDGVILGSLFVKRKGNSLSIKREFKTTGFTSQAANATPGEKKIQSETVRLLREGSLTFKVYFPTASECRSNLGEISLGLLQYKMPLLESVEKPGNKVWDYKITTIF